VALLLFGFPSFLFGQSTEERFVQERLVENLRRRKLEKYVRLRPEEEAILAKTKKLLWDAGGWIDVGYTEFRNDDNDRNAKDTFDADLSVDSNVWIEVIYRPNLEADYVREHTAYIQFNNFYISRWPDGGEIAIDDNDGPHVDSLYIDLDLGLLTVRIGRQYLSVGQGISYGNVHDGIQLTGYFGDWLVESFAAKTLPQEGNIDFSVPGFDKTSERYFIGNQVKWTANELLSVYAYALIQHDQSDERPESSQDFAYHSQYWGFEVYGRGRIFCLV